MEPPPCSDRRLANDSGSASNKSASEAMTGAKDIDASYGSNTIAVIK